jgi:hypothetical protein
MTDCRLHGTAAMWIHCNTVFIMLDEVQRREGEGVGRTHSLLNAIIIILLIIVIKYTSIEGNPMSS